MTKFTDPPIFTQTYDLIKWIYEEPAIFPKYQRFLLANQIQDESLELLKCFISLRQNFESESNFKRADIHLETLILLLRLAKDLTFLKFRKYETVTKMLDEIGRLLGDWQKRKSV